MWIPEFLAKQTNTTTCLFLGSSDTTRFGAPAIIAAGAATAGVVNATRQTGSVLGLALFGSLVSKTSTFILGTKDSLIISALLLICASIVILVDGILRGKGNDRLPARS